MPINTLPQTSQQQQQFIPINTIPVDPILITGFNDLSQTNELRDLSHEREVSSYVTNLQSATNPAYGMGMTMNRLSSREIAVAEVPPLVTQQNYETSNTMTTDTNLFMTSSPAYFFPPQQSMPINLGSRETNVSFDNSFVDLYQHSSLPSSSHINTPTSLLHQIQCIYTGLTNAENDTLLEAPQQQEVLFPDMLINNTTTSIHYAYKQAIEQQEQFIPSLKTPTSSPLPPQQMTQQFQLDIPAFPSVLPVEEGLKNIKQHQIPTTKEDNKTLNFNSVDVNSHHFHSQSNVHSAQQINDPQSLVQPNGENSVPSPPSSPRTEIIDPDHYSSTLLKDYQQQEKNKNIMKNKNNNQQQPISGINENFTKRMEQEEMQQTTKVYLDPSDTNDSKIKVDPDILKEIRIKQVLSQHTNFTSSSITAPVPIPLEIFKQKYGKENSATTKINNCHGHTQPLASSSSTSSLASTSSLSLTSSLSASSSSSSSSASASLPSSGQSAIPSSNNNQSSNSRQGKITNTDISKQIPWDITRKINPRKRKHITSSTEPSFLISRFKSTLTSKTKKDKQQGEEVLNANSSYNNKEKGENEKEVQGRQCPHCPKIVSRARDLPRHIVTHIKDYLAFRCERCGRTYRRKDSELRHNKNCS
ncbi:hypothetical protein INT45_013592 [Circinella minor]|uniref:C2H2-type domain-containing protein n=1 Tax=Circinella minor TaxID=1195481 RepID=A0A8H7RNT3_9FUNG|nr:hypothetical protein INT45_013592 [Circinella minor]